MTQAKILLHAYSSPSMVLLAFNWAIGVKRNDFLCFALQRKPAFDINHSNWLPNGNGFGDSASEGKDLLISYSPIEKFMIYRYQANKPFNSQF